MPNGVLFIGVPFPPTSEAEGFPSRIFGDERQKNGFSASVRFETFATEKDQNPVNFLAPDFVLQFVV
jgi:hypothetical protein